MQYRARIIKLLVFFFLIQLLPKTTIAALNLGESLDDRLYGTIVMYKESPKIYINNTVTYFDRNNLEIKPFVKDGRTLIPILFILEKSCSNKIYSPDNSIIEMTYQDSRIQILPKACKMSFEVNGVITDIPVENINQRLYVRVTDLSKILNRKLFIYNDLMILSIRSKIFDINTEKDLINETASRVSNNSTVIPVLMYHHFQSQVPQSHIGTIVTPLEFEEHIKYFKENNYNFIFFSDLYDYVHSGKALPDNPIIITIDDGYESNYKYAFPILKKYGAKATIFIVTDFVGKNVKDFPHFSWEQAKEMQDSGFVDIQNHTQKHNFLDNMSKKDILASVLNAQKLIDTKLGIKKLRVLAYPGGNHNKHIRNMLIEQGFNVQLTGQDRLVTKHTDLTDICRINIRHGLTSKDILRIIGNLK